MRVAKECWLVFLDALPISSHRKTVLVAMACSVPVVASATGGILEEVVDGVTGYLVPFEQDPVTTFPSQPEQFARDLATRLNDLLESPPKRSSSEKPGAGAWKRRSLRSPSPRRP